MNYLIRSIDTEKWKKFKSQCALEGKSIKQVILDFINEYANFSFDEFNAFVELKTKQEENSRETTSKRTNP